ncbi:hypothetical protein AB0I00_24810 [Streptomyces sp. NPDC050803]|uniref:hypothetical protein n=1 Tax=unclassified Streptomyces TaxID=2593676 RepID=UPI003432DFFC
MPPPPVFNEAGRRTVLRLPMPGPLPFAVAGVVVAVDLRLPAPGLPFAVAG